MEMRQLIDNPFTALQSTLKMRLSQHKQIKAAVFVGQIVYCMIKYIFTLQQIENYSRSISSVRRTFSMEVLIQTDDAVMVFSWLS